MTINDRIAQEKNINRKKALELSKKYNNSKKQTVEVIIDSRTTIHVSSEKFNKMGKKAIIDEYNKKYAKKY